MHYNWLKSPITYINYTARVLSLGITFIILSISSYLLSAKSSLSDSQTHTSGQVLWYMCIGPVW